MGLQVLSPIHLARKGQKELDYLGYAMILITLVITIPQVTIIYENESAQDVSLITWVGYTIIGIWWFFYGIEKKIHPMILSATIHVIIDIIVVYGIITFEGVNFNF